MTSRDTSPLSSYSSSPSANTPKRSRSLSLSSASPSPPPANAQALHHPDSYDELEMSDQDTSTPKLNSKKRGGAGANKYGYDPAALPTTQCQWGNCMAEFYELEPLIEHIHAVHAFPINPQDVGTKKALIYNCEWRDCPRVGKNQTSKFALVGHIRSHTGEKPFNCPRPECDKSFTRTDALQKHMRTQHKEVIGPSRRPPSKKARTAAARAGSIDSADTPFDGGDNAGAGGDDEDDGLEPVWNEEELELFEKHPGVSRVFLGYVVEKAKWAYAMGQHEGMAAEVEALGIREAELGAECEELLRRVMRKELGDDPTDPTNATMLGSFLTSYSHRPLVVPDEWTGDKPR
ncbi:hypothetical protein P7C70_g4124, partial [Phenoliferia sp. Uapishka_3]